VDRDLSRMTDYLVLLVDVRRPEVDEYIDDKHDIDDQVYYRDWIVIPTASENNKTKYYYYTGSTLCASSKKLIMLLLLL